MYRPVPARIDLPAMEQEVLGFWDANDVFHRSLAATRDGEPWVFYEGPPTANGRPGSHHVLARVFKDIYPRFQTMRGRLVERKAGWDTHGLPVEIAVEQELGITTKAEIEAYCAEQGWNVTLRTGTTRDGARLPARPARRDRRRGNGLTQHTPHLGGGGHTNDNRHQQSRRRTRTQGRRGSHRSQASRQPQQRPRRR